MKKKNKILTLVFGTIFATTTLSIPAVVLASCSKSTNDNTNTQSSITFTEENSINLVQKLNTFSAFGSTSVKNAQSSFDNNILEIAKSINENLNSNNITIKVQNDCIAININDYKLNNIAEYDLKEPYPVKVKINQNQILILGQNLFLVEITNQQANNIANNLITMSQNENSDINNIIQKIKQMFNKENNIIVNDVIITSNVDQIATLPIGSKITIQKIEIIFDQNKINFYPISYKIDKPLAGSLSIKTNNITFTPTNEITTNIVVNKINLVENKFSDLVNWVSTLKPQELKQNATNLNDYPTQNAAKLNSNFQNLVATNLGLDPNQIESIIVSCSNQIWINKKASVSLNITIKFKQNFKFDKEVIINESSNPSSTSIVNYGEFSVVAKQNSSVLEINNVKTTFNFLSMNFTSEILDNIVTTITSLMQNNIIQQKNMTYLNNSLQNSPIFEQISVALNVDPRLIAEFKIANFSNVNSFKVEIWFTSAYSVKEQSVNSSKYPNTVLRKKAERAIQIQIEK